MDAPKSLKISENLNVEAMCFIHSKREEGGGNDTVKVMTCVLSLAKALKMPTYMYRQRLIKKMQ